MRSDYRVIRKHIERVVPGFAAFEERVAQPGGFVLPRAPGDSRTFPTDNGKAHLTVNLPTAVEVPAGHLLLQTVRSHDQFNTTVYGLDDRYRGITDGRRVVFVNPDDLAALGVADGEIGRPGRRRSGRGAASRKVPGRELPDHPGLCGCVLP